MLENKNLHYDNRSILLLALPIFLEQLLSYAVGFADSLMAAQIGVAAMSGVTIVNHLAMVLSNIFMAFSIGGTIVVSYFKGRARGKLASQAAGIGMILVLLLAGIIVSCAMVYPETIINKLFAKVADEVKQETVIYWRLIVYSFLPLALYQIGAAIARGYGNTRLPLAVMAIANVINILGNYLLAYHWSWGIFGIGAASLMARSIAGLTMLALLFNHSTSMPVALTGSMKLWQGLLARMVKVAVPYGIETGLMQLGRVLLISIVSVLGTQVLACNVVAGTLSMFQVLPGMALCYTIAIILPGCYGAGRTELARFYFRKIIKLTSLVQALATVIVILLLPWSIEFYHLQGEAIHWVKNIIYLHGLFGIIIWPLANAFPMYFRAAGITLMPSVVSTGSLFICRLGLAYGFIVLLKLDYIFVWIAMFSDWTLRAACFILYDFYKLKPSLKNLTLVKI